MCALHISSVGQRLCKQKHGGRLIVDKRMPFASWIYNRSCCPQVKCISESNGFSSSCSTGPRRDPSAILPDNLLPAHIIYCSSPVMGHNKESHPESNLRVPAIMSILDKMELTTKSRGHEIIELKKYNPASVDDLVRVHSTAYILGHEKVSGIEPAITRSHGS